jgi:hypothetical protein
VLRKDHGDRPRVAGLVTGEGRRRKSVTTREGGTPSHPCPNKAE